MMKLKPLLVTMATLALFSCGKTVQNSANVTEAWNSSNDPLNVSNSYERRFSQLPLAAELAVIPWTDSYWPSNEGGIASRWNSENPQPFKYVSPGLSQLKTWTNAQLAELSPAEKYDILLGKYNYPTVASERARTSPDDEGWEGICHGWSPAAINFREPRPVVLKNADGISIPFGSSDVKALLSYYQGQIGRGRTRFLGSRCNIDLAKNPELATNPECRDTNAGSFHLVVTNQLGLLKQSFNVDVTRDLQVWNQPVFSYKSKVIGQRGPSAGAAPGTVKEVVIQTDMRYTIEVAAQWNALNGTSGFSAGTKNYEYRLELNAADQIIGGEWISDERPDFMWMQDSSRFQGYFGRVEEIYNASVAGSPAPVPTSVPSPVPTATVPPRPSPTPVGTAVPMPTTQPTVRPAPLPTVVPTVRPAPLPTVVPTVIPAPLPTAAPTVRPEPLPTVRPEPLPTVEPTPIIVPVPNPDFPAIGRVDCPAGFQLRFAGPAGGMFCTDGVKILGPVTEAMFNACMQNFHQDCHDANWSLANFIRYRGTNICPLGATFDVDTKYCVEGNSAFGPFTRELKGKCVAAGGGPACETVRWDRNFLLSLQRN